MNQPDWLDEVLGKPIDPSYENSMYWINESDKEWIKSQILAKLTQVELEGRIDEVNRYEKTAQTLSENAMFNYAEIRLAQLNRLKEQK